jgi:hypothetical protein
MLAPRREVQQCLGERLPAAGGTRYQQAADFLSARRAARLARDDGRDVPLLQGLLQALGLGRLAAALAALEGDEAGGHAGVRWFSFMARRS